MIIRFLGHSQRSFKSSFLDCQFWILISNSVIEKAFLFDIVSKMYIATDCSPVDMQSYELCCDMIDVVIVHSEETAVDNKSSSLIRLNSSTILYLREVTKFLALVCILREDNFSRQGVIDYNFLCFREVTSEVFELRMKNQKLETLKEKDEDEDEDDYKLATMVNGGNSIVN